MVTKLYLKLVEISLKSVKCPQKDIFKEFGYKLEVKAMYYNNTTTYYSVYFHIGVGRVERTPCISVP